MYGLIINNNVIEVSEENMKVLLTVAQSMGVTKSNEKIINKS